MKFRILIKSFILLAIIMTFFVNGSVRADSVKPEISFTREKTTYPTAVVVHILIKDSVRSNSVKVKITGPNNYSSGDKLILISSSSEEINGSDYLSFKTSKEFPKSDTDTYVGTAVVVDENGSAKSDQATASFVVNDGMGQGTTINPKVIAQTKDTSGKSIKDTSYTYLAPLPGFGESFDISQPDAISKYIGILFKLILGVMGVIAVFRIITLGIKTMSDSFSQKKFAKEKLTNIIAALIIALCSVLILNTINPKLVNFDFGVQKLNLEINSIKFISKNTYENITGIKLADPSKYDADAKAVTKKLNIPYCSMRVILQRESQGNPGAIGFDSNVPNANIGARQDFIKSGKKYTGTTFKTSNSLIVDKNFINDDSNFTNTDTLGLDWRFTHGIGLTQVTCQPKTTDWNQKDQLPNCTFAGTSYTPKELLKPEKNLEAGGRLWAYYYKACNKDVFKTWKAYASGSCESPNKFAVEEATVRTDLYNQCIKEGF
ncbi:MAG: hypothetical protein WCO58_01905 [bacterium]